ncbi:SMP-30/gluconolactonase/LRE family protein [Gammaproteobacteria bacterium]|nr:SMP-30/gluconolactonase/LRE family protein [Gammaproteobacteria bacterium]|tara:strand:+ start:84 stop:1094 length:1011 start_codon:yes stop_codon:yes gene_type:complete
MNCLKKIIVVGLAGLLLSMCGSDNAAEFEIKDNAGTIERNDPRIDALIPADANIEKLAEGFTFTEGPVWDRRNDQLYFSDVRDNTIYSWSEKAGAKPFIQPVYSEESDHPSVGSNGLTLDDEGRLILMEHGYRRVSRLENGGDRTTLVDTYREMRLNSPNDVAWHSNGWLYFTDPSYGLAGLENDPLRELDYNGIYRLSPDGEIQLLERNQTRPNGLAFSPDEETLYVANSDAENKVWYAYNVIHGIIGNPRIFFDANDQTATGAADGMKVDENGNIFATGPGGVWVFDPDGSHLGTIKPDEVPANVAWGDDGSTLYMTARTGLYRVRLNTRGEIL